MACSVKNCFLVNAPAGSGKTTKIKAMVNDILAQNPNDNILCITYTNRAADELSKDFKTKNIFVGTIHSFLNSFMSRYFSHSDILKLYFEIYGDKIKERILNSKNDENVAQSNAKYIEKYDKLDYETIKYNIKTIYYCESSFNRLYYCGLSHDDLISFSKLIFDRYPILKTRISAKYQYVFVDEYQDTMADVLKIFFESIVGTNSKLYLFGDRMQQIYNNYNGSFEAEFELFDNTVSLNTNYRSTSEIVSVLNKLYNDREFVQKNKANTNNKSTLKPVIIITNNVEESLNRITTQDPDTLVLYLLNRSRFTSIGALNLYMAYAKMEKYSYEKNYSAILTAPYEDNSDSLLRFLYCVMELCSCYKKRQYGVIIQIINANTKSNSSPMFSRQSTLITKHSDKQRIYDSLKRLFDELDTDMPISDFLNRAKDTGLFNEEYIADLISDSDIGLVLPVSVAEPKRVYEYLSDPRVSTQHGVKGESHESVVFVADDNNRSNPIVYMYRFFYLLAQVNVSLKTFNSFYYRYASIIIAIESEKGIKISKMNKATFDEHKEMLLNEANRIMDEFGDNPYFSYLCQEGYSEFLQKKTMKSAQACFRLSKVNGVLSAYKLFYVGCSRAREKLTILIDRNKMQGDIALQIIKFKDLGFEVIQ